MIRTTEQDAASSVETPAPQTEAPLKPPPKPIVKKMRWPFPIIWIVPIAAAIATGLYMYRHNHEGGPIISIAFTDVDGVKEDETPVQYRGVEIGKVSAVELAENGSHAIVRIRLYK